MTLLYPDEYEEIYEAVENNQEAYAIICEDGPVDIDSLDAKTLEELSGAHAVYFQGGPGYDRRVRARDPAEQALGHLENGGTLDQFLKAMEHIEEIMEENYKRNK